MIEPVGLLPFIPGGADFQRSRALFRELGCTELWSNESLAGFRYGAARFILHDFNDAKVASNLMIKVEVPDIDAWYREVEAKDLPGKFTGFRMNPPKAFPWGSEVHFIDLAGVCWHVGQP